MWHRVAMERVEEKNAMRIFASRMWCELTGCEFFASYSCQVTAACMHVSMTTLKGVIKTRRTRRDRVYDENIFYPRLRQHHESVMWTLSLSHYDSSALDWQLFFEFLKSNSDAPSKCEVSAKNKSCKVSTKSINIWCCLIASKVYDVWLCSLHCFTIRQ